MHKKVLLKKTLVIGIFILFVGVVIAPTISSFSNQLINKNVSSERVSFNPFKLEWKYRKQITIDHTKVAGNLVNFPVLVSTVDADLKNKAQIDGDDILFMDSKGEAEQLFHEIESYDSTIGKLVAWVNIPTVSNAIDIDFYMYYGNSTCGSQEFTISTWDSYHCGVWHLNDLLDSTINGNDGGNHGAVDCTGKIGNAKDFEKDYHNYVDLGDMPEPADDITSRATFEAWVNPETLTTTSSIINKIDTTYEPDIRSYKFEILQTGQIRFSVQSGTWTPTDDIIRFTTNDNLVTTGSWQHVAAFIDLSIRGDTALYYNGEEQSYSIQILGYPPSHFYNVDLDERLGLLNQEAGAIYYDGSIDEVRVSKVERSSEWISTEYNNQNDVLSFLTIGPEETKSKSLYKILIFNYLEQFQLLNLLLQFVKLH